MVDIDPDYKKYMWLNDIATSPEKISITHLREAVDSAHQALDMDLQCRRKTFAFVVRFNGKLKAKHSRSSNDCSQKLNKAKRKKVSLTNNKQSETWPPSPHGHNLPDIIPTGEYEFNRIKSSTPVEKPAFKRKLWNASDLFSEKSVSPVQESENCPTVSKRFAIIQRGKCDKRETKQRGHVSCSKQGEFSWQSDRDQSGENVDEKGKQSGDSADKKGIYEEPKKKKKFECDKYLEDDIGKKIKAKNHCTKCSANSNTKQDKFEKQDKEEEVEEENGGLFKKQVEYEEQGDDYEDENEEKCDNVNKKQSKKKCIFKKCNTDGDSEEPNNKDGEYMEQEDTNSNYEHPSGKDGKNREFCNKDGTDGNNELNNECDVQVQDDTIVDDELYNKDANYEEVYNGGDDEEHSNKGSDYEEVYNGGDEECCSKDAEYEESCNGDKEPYNKDADFEIYNGDEEHCIKNVDYKGYSGGGDEEPCNKDVEYEDYNSGGEEHCNKNADYEEGYNDGEEEHCNKNADYEEGYNDGEEEHCNKNADYEEGYNDGEEEHCNKNADYEEGYNDGEEEHCNKNADYEEGYNDGEEEHCNKNADYEEGYNDGEEEHCNKNADHEQDYNGGGGDESCNKDADYEGYNGNEDEHCSKDADYEGYNGGGCDEPCNKDAGNETDTFLDDKHKEPDNHKGEYKEKDNIAEYERSSDGEYEPWEDDDCGNQNNDGEFDNDDGNKECDKNNNSECEDQDNSDDECENQDINSEYEDEKGDCEEPKKNDGNLGSENDELNNNEHQDNDDYEEQDYDEGDNAEDGENDDFDNQNNGYEQGESYEDNDKQYDSGDSEEQGSEARKEHSKDSEDEGDSKDACENQEINHVEYKDDDKGDYEESKENDENRGSENVEQYNNSEYKDNGEYHEEQDFDDEKDNAENEEHDFEKQNNEHGENYEDNDKQYESGVYEEQGNEDRKEYGKDSKYKVQDHKIAYKKQSDFVGECEKGDNEDCVKSCTLHVKGGYSDHRKQEQCCFEYERQNDHMQHNYKLKIKDNNDKDGMYKDGSDSENGKQGSNKGGLRRHSDNQEQGDSETDEQSCCMCEGSAYDADSEDEEYSDNVQDHKVNLDVSGVFKYEGEASFEGDQEKRKSEDFTVLKNILKTDKNIHGSNVAVKLEKNKKQCDLNEITGESKDEKCTIKVDNQAVEIDDSKYQYISRYKHRGQGDLTSACELSKNGKQVDQVRCEVISESEPEMLDESYSDSLSALGIPMHKSLRNSPELFKSFRDERDILRSNTSCKNNKDLSGYVSPTDAYFVSGCVSPVGKHLDRSNYPSDHEHTALYRFSSRHLKKYREEEKSKPSASSSCKEDTVKVNVSISKSHLRQELCLPIKKNRPSSPDSGENDVSQEIQLKYNEL
ncbi:myb-like protein X isoform X2 [Cherax quadricarinatus]|uniref:myb-like protein X isoform X2 n=1 Tax=Cherax quadricarinatus TaxID=27406 RepID=UPI00387E8A61